MASNIILYCLKSFEDGHTFFGGNFGRHKFYFRRFLRRIFSSAIIFFLIMS